MGNLSARLRSRSSNFSVSPEANQIYYYSPSKSFFSDYFVLGGERFETDSNDYLFGENSDLNYFACARPSPYPYVDQLSVPSKKQSVQASKQRSRAFMVNVRRGNRRNSRINGNNNAGRGNDVRSGNKKQNQRPDIVRSSNTEGLKPSHTLKSLLNIRKETLRIVKVDTTSLDGSQTSATQHDDQKTSTKQKLSENNQDSSNAGPSGEDNDSQTTLNTDRRNEASGSSKSRQTINKKACSLSDDDDTTITPEDERSASSASNSSASSSSADSSESENFIDCPTSPTTTTGSPSSSSNSSSKSASNSIDETVLETSSPKVACTASSSSQVPRYRIEFVFDTEVRCSIRIYFLCTREVNSNGVMHKLHCNSYESKVYQFERGSDQRFMQTDDLFEPTTFAEHELSYRPYDEAGNFDLKAVFPIVIHCMALEGSYPRQSHTLIATIERSSVEESSYSIKPIKQLLFVDGVQYLLQEIYGFENKRLAVNDWPINCSSASEAGKENENSTDGNPLTTTTNTDSFCDSQFECVICMSEERNTVLLPCRHMSLCDSCARSLRYQANNCPICRAPFRALIHIRAIRKVTNGPLSIGTSAQHSQQNRAPHQRRGGAASKASRAAAAAASRLAPRLNPRSSDVTRRAPIKNRWSLETATLNISGGDTDGGPQLEAGPVSITADVISSSSGRDSLQPIAQMGSASADESSVDTLVCSGTSNDLSQIEPRSTLQANEQVQVTTATCPVVVTSDVGGESAQTELAVNQRTGRARKTTKRSCRPQNNASGPNVSPTSTSATVATVSSQPTTNNGSDALPPAGSLLPPGYKFTPLFRDSFKQELNN